MGRLIESTSYVLAGAAVILLFVGMFISAPHSFLYLPDTIYFFLSGPLAVCALYTNLLLRLAGNREHLLSEPVYKAVLFNLMPSGCAVIAVWSGLVELIVVDDILYRGAALPIASASGFLCVVSIVGTVAYPVVAWLMQRRKRIASSDAESLPLLDKTDK